MANTEFIEFLHQDDDISNLEDFILRNELIDITSSALLNYSGNAERILRSYLPEDGSRAIESILRSPTLIRVPVSAVPREIIAVSGNLKANKDFNAFWGDRINEIINSTEYVQAEGFSFSKTLNKITVFVWCKSLGAEGRVIDISPFVESSNTSVSKNGGDFSISLSNIEYEFDSEGFLSLSELVSAYQNNEFYSRYASNKKPFSLFELCVQNKDIVFIKFEPLEIESNSVRNKNLFVDPTSLSNHFWDMIAVVDSVSSINSFVSYNHSLNIEGRDLTALLSDDGNYFYPLDFLASEDEYFDNDTFVRGDRLNQPIRRLITGELNFFNAYVDRSVEYSLKFIFNLLSNIEVCDDSLFINYPASKKTTRYEFYTPNNSANEDDLDGYEDDVVKKIEDNNSVNEERKKKKLQQIEAPGIWKIIKLIIGDQISDRRLVDSSISTDQGTIFDFTKKVCQDPFAEFWGDTFGQNYYFIARKPPFSKNAFKENFTIDIKNENLLEMRLSFETEVYSWYRLNPRGNYFGDDTISLIDFPAIYFDRYCKIWGSKPFDVVSNYIDYKGWLGSSAGQNLAFLKDQALQDLHFIIESNSYKPFTRKGTLILNGDRRIKVGMNIFLEQTGEVFHVVGVKNNFTVKDSGVDRITLLQVERGMVKEHIDKYFDIINLEKFGDGSVNSYRFNINEEIFDFLISRKQFRK